MRQKILSNKVPTIPKVIIKSIIAFFLLICIIGSIVPTVGIIFEGDYKKDTANMINQCNRAYYDRDYAELRDTLTLYDLYSSEFDKYWEVVNGYDDYLIWLQWNKAKQVEIESTDNAQSSSNIDNISNEDISKKAELYKEKVKKNVTTSKFPENESILKEFADLTNKQ